MRGARLAGVRSRGRRRSQRGAVETYNDLSLTLVSLRCLTNPLFEPAALDRDSQVFAEQATARKLKAISQHRAQHTTAQKLSPHPVTHPSTSLLPRGLLDLPLPSRPAPSSYSYPLLPLSPSSSSRDLLPNSSLSLWS